MLDEISRFDIVPCPSARPSSGASATPAGSAVRRVVLAQPALRPCSSAAALDRRSSAELVELVALRGDPYAPEPRRRGRPRSGTSTAPRRDDVDRGRTDSDREAPTTSGAPSERATPATVRRCSESLNTSDRRGDLLLGAGRHRAHVARLPRRSRATPPRRAAGRWRSGAGAGAGSGRRRLERPAVDPGHRAPPAAALAPRRRRRPRSERRAGPALPGSSYSGTVPSRTQPSWSARDVHSSHTERRTPPSTYTSARSPRSSVRPQTSQTCPWSRCRCPSWWSRGRLSRRGYALTASCSARASSTTFPARWPGTSS